jgi:hypothetical protein
VSIIVDIDMLFFGYRHKEDLISKCILIKIFIKIIFFVRNLKDMLLKNETIFFSRKRGLMPKNETKLLISKMFYMTYKIIIGGIKILMSKGGGTLELN